MFEDNYMGSANVPSHSFHKSNLYSWAASTLPPQEGLGLLLNATEKGEIKWDVYNISLSLGPKIYYFNRALVAIPGEVSPFLITPVNWFFTFIMWNHYSQGYISQNYLHLGPLLEEVDDDDILNTSRGFKITSHTERGSKEASLEEPPSST
ncbi:uncharacterized protein G2W53_016417 [Senna tora]|uniref:Uncharacterized protein n=1 Tax=Senna tora TaxID=362788 RepID=A0A834TMP5_9FABA|nr:uncharacterized protein G2W53_016417 [Senna tora]